MRQSFPPLHLSDFWAGITDHLVEIVDHVSDDQLDWAPDAKSWSMRVLLVHIMGARHHWLANAVKDGEPTPDFVNPSRTKDGLKEQLRLSWERLTRFVCDQQKLDALYEPPGYDPPYAGDPAIFNGHFIAYHRLVHDVHHRGDILHRLALLGVELPETRRRRPL